MHTFQIEEQNIDCACPVGHLQADAVLHQPFQSAPKPPACSKRFSILIPRDPTSRNKT